MDEPPRREKKGSVITELRMMVGKSVGIYKALVSLLAHLYLLSNNHLFATIRADLLMSLHDAGVSEVIQNSLFISISNNVYRLIG